MQDLLSHLDRQFLGNSLSDWLRAGALFVVIFLTVEFLRGMVRARRERWQSTHSAALELLGGVAAATSRLVVLSVALYFSEQFLKLPPKADRVFDVVIVAGVAVQMALWASAALRFTIERHYRAESGGSSSSGAVGVLMFVGGMVIWAVFALLALDNLGVNITALVAGLGVGGIAIALAVQTILGDLFASISIALEKSFVIGDALKLDDIEGTVEYIGIKSTRLRSVSGEQVIIANADLLKSRVRNLGRMPERRVLFRLQLDYGNESGRLDQVGDIVKRIVAAQRGARFVQCLLMTLHRDALEYEVVYFVANRADVNHAATVDAINRGIVREFAANGISFAHATQRVLLQQVPAPQAAPAVPGPASA
ncbi:MAG: mechanosensitive ion channel family protein [Pseudomonadota bacterium]